MISPAARRSLVLALSLTVALALSTAASTRSQTSRLQPSILVPESAQRHELAPSPDIDEPVIARPLDGSPPSVAPSVAAPAEPAGANPAGIQTATPDQSGVSEAARQPARHSGVAPSRWSEPVEGTSTAGSAVTERSPLLTKPWLPGGR